MKKQNRYFNRFSLRSWPLGRVITAGVLVLVLAVGSAVGVGGYAASRLVAQAQGPAATPSPAEAERRWPEIDFSIQEAAAQPLVVEMETAVVQQDIGVELYTLEYTDGSGQQVERTPLLGKELTVVITGKEENTAQYPVDIQNGTVLAEDLEPGEYTVSLLEQEGLWLPQPQQVTVKEKIVYTVKAEEVEKVKEQVVQSNQVVESQEDNAFGNSNPVVEEIHDTVTYAESATQTVAGPSLTVAVVDGSGFMKLTDGTVTDYKPVYDSAGNLTGAQRAAGRQAAAPAASAQQESPTVALAYPRPTAAGRVAGWGEAVSMGFARQNSPARMAAQPLQAVALGAVEENPVQQESPAPEPTPTQTPAPEPTQPPVTSAPPEETPAPTAEPTAAPTASPTPSPTPSPTETAGPTPTPTPTHTAEPTPSPSPTAAATPTTTPSPTPTPTPAYMGWPDSISQDKLAGYGFATQAKETTVTLYTGWQVIGGNTYYYDPASHQPVKGQQVIQGVMYNFNSDGVRTTQVRGIDVSKYQGSINWNAVKSDGIDFAIIRAGYRGYGSGALVEDSQFKSNIKGATAAGIPVGIYFYSQAVTEEEAREEALMVIGLCKGYRISYPIYFDTEKVAGDTGRADGISKAQRTACAVAFCETIRAAGYTPGVYSYAAWFYNNLNYANISKYPIWIAQYRSTLDFKYNYQLWQYTSQGRVKGISKNVDMNISH